MSDRTTLSEKSIISMIETRRKKLSLIQEVAEEIVKLLSLFIISQVRDDLTPAHNLPVIDFKWTNKSRDST